MTVAKLMRLEGSVGLTTVLIGEARLEQVIQPTNDSLMDVLASGPVPPNPAELLGLPHMQQLIAEASRRYDTVIIDSPPLLPVTDAAVLSRVADGTLVVVGSGVARRPELEKALEKLEMVDARVLGLLLTRVRGGDAGAYHYEYVYGQDGQSSSRASRDKNAPAPISSARARTGRRPTRAIQPVQ